MELAKLVSLGSEILKVMSENDGTIHDWRYLPMYYEFVNSRRNNVKYRAVIEELSDKYGLSKTKIERIIRRFRRDI